MYPDFFIYPIFSWLTDVSSMPYCLTYPVLSHHFFLQAEKLDVMLEKWKEPLNSVVELALGEEPQGK